MRVICFGVGGFESTTPAGWSGQAASDAAACPHASQTPLWGYHLHRKWHGGRPQRGNPIIHPSGRRFQIESASFFVYTIRVISFSYENRMSADWTPNRPEIGLVFGRFYPFGTPRDSCGFDYVQDPSDVIEPSLSTKNQYLAIRCSGNTRDHKSWKRRIKVRKKS